MTADLTHQWTWRCRGDDAASLAATTHILTIYTALRPQGMTSLLTCPYIFCKQQTCCVLRCVALIAVLVVSSLVFSVGRCQFDCQSSETRWLERLVSDRTIICGVAIYPSYFCCYCYYYYYYYYFQKFLLEMF